MGLCNAPAIFQRAMNETLKEHIQKDYCQIHIDNVIIFSPSLELNSVQLDSVLTTPKSHNLLCLPKCVWAQKQIKYLGHVVSCLVGVFPDLDQAKVLDELDIRPAAYLTMNEEISVPERKAIRKENLHQSA